MIQVVDVVEKELKDQSWAKSRRVKGWLREIGEETDQLRKNRASGHWRETYQIRKD